MVHSLILLLIIYIYVFNITINCLLFMLIRYIDKDTDINPVGVMICFIPLLGTLTFMVLVFYVTLSKLINNYLNTKKIKQNDF